MGSTGDYGPVSEPIAIIGLSCKLAGEANSPERLWEMLAAGRSAWSEIPSSRFNLEGAYHPKFDRLSTVNVRGGYFLEQDLGLFDAPFFSFSAETASSMDPQIRLQLESVYEALENAGITLPEVAGTNTAVYAAMFGRDYHDGMIRDEDNLPRFLPTGTGVAMLSNRVSHFYDLRGPSFTLDTGCSGGLVALHQGVQTLRSRESDMALICTSNLFLNPDLFKAMGSLGLLSPDGKSYAFDSRANGFGRGEGIATIVIKRLSDAIAAGDSLRAIIRESGLNQDGKTETITTPREEAQVALMRDCYHRARLDFWDTQYFEAHGTGTATGDPIECRAIANVFKEYRAPDDPLRIGTVKTNIGHTESTSGLASLIKVVLALEKGKIPPSINFEKPNPNLALDDWRLRVVTELEDWPVGPGGVRRASINNFGYGGTNAHLIVESPAAEHQVTLANGHTDWDRSLDSQLLIFSARDKTACWDMISNIKLYLKRNAANKNSELLLRRIAYTLGQRRTLFPWVAVRSVPVQEGLEEAIRALEFPMPAPHRTTRVPRVGLVFTGQGAQWYAMGRELIATYPIFVSSLRETDRHVKALGANWSVIEELCRDISESRVNNVELSTPLCVAVQISLVRLLRSWGLKPVAVTSHSSGEIAAAYAVGALSCKSAMAVAYHRALLAANKCLQSSNKGAMVAVGMGHREAKSYLTQLETRSGMATVACINSPASTTVSGDDSAVTEFETLARNNGIYTHRLKIETAFHSHHMKPIAGPYGMALHGLLSPAKDTDVDKITFSSPVTGGRVDVLSELLEPKYWVDSLLQPVQFVDAFTDMVLVNSDSTGSNVDVILEVGPHTALGSPIRQILAEPGFAGLNLHCLGCLVRGTSAIESMHSLAASLLAEGVPLDLDAINFPRGRPPSIGLLSDLPPYPWNHQTRHWYESRFNKALRERSQPPHDLLGNLVLGTDLHNPSWRQILRLTDTPWIREHVIQNSILFPGAGFICLAIEALRRLVDLHSKDSQAVMGYRLRDIDILQALIVPETDDGIEIQTSLRAVNDRNIGSREWKYFEISSVTSDNRWTVHARGLIMRELEDAPDKTVPKSRPARLSGYTRHFMGSDLYATLRTFGINHQKTFQAITCIEQAGNNKRADSLLSVPDTSMPMVLSHPELVHPTTLDAVIQTAYTPLLGKSEDTNGKVPRSIGSLWISSAISNNAGHKFKAVAALQHADARSMRANITMVDYDDETALPVLEIRDAVYQSLGQNTTRPPTDDHWTKEPCIKLKWAPDISLLSNPAREYIRQQLSHPMNIDETRTLLALRRVCLYYISDAIAALTSGDIYHLESHHAKFFVWMQHQVKLAADGRLGPDSRCWLDDTPVQRERLIAEVRNTSVNGEMACQLGPHLPVILRKQKAPLELMMEGNLLNRYYRHALRADRVLPQAANILEYIIHKNPRARILEIGGGTGGFTRYALPKIGTFKTGGPLAELYHFTDISPSFFNAAQEEFAPWSDIMLFDKLDIEVDPASQGFDLESYDVVIAAQVLHATTSMARTMSNVRKLLKPGGTLLLVETTQDQLDTQFSFGLLPGWWLSEEPQRALSPSLSIPFWDETLRTAGFSGIDFHVRDCESDEWYMMSVITSTAGPPPQLSFQPSDSVLLVVRQQAPCEQLWLNYLRSNLATAGRIPAVVELETAPAEAYKGKVVVFLGEVDHPLLHGLGAAGLKRIQTMIKHSRGLLWVTRGGTVDCERPELSLAIGFLRSIRHECAGAKYVTLDLDPKAKLWSCAAVTAITQVFNASFGTLNGGAVTSPTYEFEYAEREGVILVPRLFRDNDRNKALSPRVVDCSSSDSVSTEPFFQPDRPLVLKVGIPGLLDTIAFDDLVSPSEGSRHPPDLIEIEPRAYGVNFRDVLVAMGQLEERIMGVDCAGIITRVGSRAAARGYAAGDQVFALLPEGGYGSRARVEWTNVMHMPPGLSFEHAASVPALFTTVYLCFYKVARLQRGQTVLIHAGAGGIGQTAIQFAQLIGAEVYTTVGSPEKRALIMERYGIPSDHIFSSRNASFAAGILEATGGHGVDVVLNSLAGPLLQESLNIVAPFGHFIEIGKRDIEQNSHLEMRPFSRHITFSSFDLLALAQHDGRLIHSALAEVGYLLEKGTISPVHPVSTYPLGDIAKAFRLLQTGKHTGKIVLTISPQEQVRVLPRARAARFRSDASYLLVGGSGGIGQSIAHWLATHGARNLIILSRSAATNPAAIELMAELQPIGCNVKLISCDATIEPNLAAALETCSKDLPPIRGVIQTAMVVRDSVFEQMRFDDWQASLNPKVKVSWNLHNQFRTADLDFFVLLSSMSGIYGYTTQSNYSAANTYVDALAHWRVSQGLPAVALDLGPVRAVGFIAESAEIVERMTRVGHYPVTEEQVLRVLELAILSPFDKQVALGINQGPGPHWDPNNASPLGRDARFRALQYRKKTQCQAAGPTGGASTSLAARLSGSETLEEAEGFVVEAIAKRLAEIFMIPIAHIDAARRLTEYGLDSLGAVELSNMLALQAAVDVSIFDIMQSESLAALASEVTRKSAHVNTSLMDM